jgi:predicted flap endonuclease-1-like 5' DNA nuclease
VTPAVAATSTASGSTSHPFRSIKGIGEVTAERLAGLGVDSTEQIAAWQDADIDRVASEIKVSAERIRREDWVGQARSLVKA